MFCKCGHPESEHEPENSYYAKTHSERPCQHESEGENDQEPTPCFCFNFEPDEEVAVFQDPPEADDA